MSALTAPTEREIVESASNEGAAVLTLQRKDIIALREFEEKLLEELAGEPTKLYITQYQGQIVEKVDRPHRHRASPDTADPVIRAGATNQPGTPSMGD